ncbi:alpha/beta hydrolase family esterase [Paracoccus pacificus]|uniref:Alpha/beta hydrolase family esterase n=1 Tax=Paracoccus pacificus TaxID=1463598 RepID=A0ABW4R6A4_9RHOB
MNGNLPSLTDIYDRMRKLGSPIEASNLVRDTLAANGITTPGLPGVTAEPTDMERMHAETAHGSRDYLIFRPAKPADKPAVVVMLHGCTQNAADFALGTGMNAAADKRGAYVIYPEQAIEANPMRCWNWFEPANQVKSGESALLAELIAHALKAEGLSNADVFVAGMSAGGAMAAILANSYPRRFRAAGIHSGLPVGAAASVGGAMAAMKSDHPQGAVPASVPLIIFHGGADRVVHPANGEKLADRIKGGAVYRGRPANGRRWSARKSDAGEIWLVDGLGHAWSGGNAQGSHTDPDGPDASAEMLRFFWEHRDRV